MPTDTETALSRVDPERTGGPMVGGVTGRGFLPGQSGNPGGRPKGEPSLAAIRRRRLAEPVAGTPWASDAAKRLGLGEQATFADLLIETELHAAIARGDARALASVADRMDGKPRQSAAVTGGEQVFVKWSIEERCEPEFTFRATFAEHAEPVSPPDPLATRPPSDLPNG